MSGVSQPWIVTHVFNYELSSIIDSLNKLECKACGSKVTWYLSGPTSNLTRHLKNTNIIKHAKILEELKLCKSPGKKEINAKRKLENTFTKLPNCQLTHPPPQVLYF